jgi:hypothetical protein
MRLHLAGRILGQTQSVDPRARKATETMRPAPRESEGRP